LTVRLQIHTSDVRAFFDEAVGDLLSDAAAGADDDNDLAREFFFGRHAAQLGLFKEPVLDVEGFLLWERSVLVDGLRAAHDFNCADVELGRDPGFTLVFAERNHAEAGNQNDRRVRIAHGRRIRSFAPLIVSGVIHAVLLEANFEFRLEHLDVGDDGGIVAVGT